MKPATTQPIELYGRETSGNTYKARLLMAFLDVAYEQIEVRLGPGGRNQVDESYRSLNPRGQVPTLVDGDTVLWGSTAILVYLAAQYDPSGHWLPRHDPAALGRVMQWLELARNEISTGLFRARAIAGFGYSGDIEGARRDGGTSRARAVFVRLSHTVASRRAPGGGGGNPVLLNAPGLIRQTHARYHAEATFFERVCCVARVRNWPAAAVHGSAGGGCNGRQTGRSADEARTAVLDPLRTQMIRAEMHQNPARQQHPLPPRRYEVLPSDFVRGDKQKMTVSSIFYCTKPLSVEHSSRR
jgi:glutathione S-transferase